MSMLYTYDRMVWCHSNFRWISTRERKQWTLWGVVDWRLLGYVSSTTIWQQKKNFRPSNANCADANALVYRFEDGSSDHTLSAPFFRSIAVHKRFFKMWLLCRLLVEVLNQWVCLAIVVVSATRNRQCFEGLNRERGDCPLNSPSIFLTSLANKTTLLF